jgi:DNA-binding response OmpR family regulator
MKVLVVDDDIKIVKVLTAYLEKDGYSVITANDGVAAVDKALHLNPDIILLDLMLPKLDGFGVCKEIRRSSNIPILMLTARDAESDRIIGLELGADDYVIKPFSPKEVIARIRAIQRRINPSEPQTNTEVPLQMGKLTFHKKNHSVFLANTPIELTPTEYKILELCLNHPGQLFSRLQLIEKIQGYSFEGYERTVDSHIKNLRKKLKALPEDPYYIKTIYGVGYKLTGEQHA